METLIVNMETSGSHLKNQLFVVSGVLISILSCGLRLGFPLDKQGLSLNSNSAGLSDKSLEYIGSAGELAFIPSIVIIPFTMQNQGRRIAAIVTMIPLLLSWLLSFNANNFTALIIVNILHHISLGGVATVSSIIISEFCSPKYRSVFLMLETVMISLGVLLSHICEMFSYIQIIIYLGTFTSMIGLIVTYFWPESPYWLVSKGHLNEGAKNFYWLRGRDDEAIKEINKLLTQQKVKQQLKAFKPIRVLRLRDKVADYLKSLLKEDFLKPLSIMILIFSFVGVGGDNLLTNTSLRSIFNLNVKYVGTIILDALTVICSLIACVLIQVVKRKTLFLFTGSFCIVFLGLMSLFLFLQTLDWFIKQYLWLFLTLVTGFVMFMSLGTTALPFSMLGEIFPMSYKGIGSSLTCAYLWGFGNSMIQLIPSITSSLGVHGMLLLFAVIMALLLVVISLVLPCTDLKSLLEINKSKMCENNDDEVILDDVDDSETFEKLKLFIEV